MARKTQLVTISEEGRDIGKVFLLTEMPASQAERWAVRAFLAMARSGLDIPEDIANMGMAGIAAFGFRALGGISYADAEPLLDEMFSCIQHIPDPARPDIVRKVIESDIEEVSTRLFLRKEVFGLHVNFLFPAALSNSTSPAVAG